MTEPLEPAAPSPATDLPAQPALLPATGELVKGDTAAQTRQVMKNLEAVLIAAGGALGGHAPVAPSFLRQIE